MPDTARGISCNSGFSIVASSPELLIGGTAGVVKVGRASASRSFALGRIGGNAASTAGLASGAGSLIGAAATAGAATGGAAGGATATGDGKDAGIAFTG